MPKKFPSLSSFEEEYSSLEEQEKLTKLHAELKPHLLRRLKKDVEKVCDTTSLPIK